MKAGQFLNQTRHLVNIKRSDPKTLKKKTCSSTHMSTIAEDNLISTLNRTETDSVEVRSYSRTFSAEEKF